VTWASTSEMTLSVITEYVPWRLHLIQSSLTREQALFLLAGSCKGFRELLHKIRHPFRVTSSMIGVNESGEVRVWWNQNFSKNNFGFILNTGIRM
jgi:hypothetical protein